MKMNKKVRTVLYLLIASVLISFPTVFSYMIKETEQVVNNLDPAQVTCEVVEVYDGTTKTSIQIKNTGNVSAYIRVKIVHYIEDTKGNAVGQSSTLSDFSTAPGWQKDEANVTKNYVTYYYIYPINPGELTPNLLADGSKIVLAQTSSTPETADPKNAVTFYYNQAVEIHAEAIQAKPYKAVESSWSVKIDTSTGSISQLNVPYVEQ